jgi:hypothetical protein
MHFQKFEEKYIDDVVELSDKNLGKNFKTKEQYLDIHHNFTESIDIIVVDGKAVGMNVVKTIHINFLSSHLLNGYDQIFDLFPNNSFIHFHIASAIEEEYNRVGIRTKLFDFSENHLKDISPYWLSVAWAPGKIVRSDKLFRAFGLTPTLEIENYWFYDSLKRNYICAACGNPPCTCMAILYTKG